MLISKKKLIAASDTDSVVTGLTSGHAVRGVKNKFTEMFLALERQCTPRRRTCSLGNRTNRLAAVDGDVENGMVQAGQSLLPLTKIEPVKDIIETIMAEANKSLAQASELL